MKSLLKVSLPDGRIIQEAKPTDTFVSSICELGLEEVNASGYMANKKSGVPLVGKDKETYTSLVDGWYIYTHWDVNKMAAILNTLAGQLEFDLKAEVVSSDLPDRKVSSDRRILIEIEGKSYAEKFKKVICLLGVERVKGLNIIRAGRNIIYAPAVGQKPLDGQIDLNNGYFLNAKFSNDDKDKILKEIAERLSVALTISVQNG
jgi:hypothetical protein